MVVVRPQDRTVEQRIGELAGGAHGLVMREELLRAGITVAAIKWRLRTGALRGYPGVYRAGHRAPNIEARYLAAVLACGTGRASAPEVLTATERRVAGVVAHRSRHGHPCGMTWRGVPVTTVARTLVDLAATLSLDESTATATTTLATPGSRTAGASARRAPAETSFAATHTRTCSSIRAPCSPSFGLCSRRSVLPRGRSATTEQDAPGCSGSDPPCQARTSAGRQ